VEVTQSGYPCVDADDGRDDVGFAGVLHSEDELGPRRVFFSGGGGGTMAVRVAGQ